MTSISRRSFLKTASVQGVALGLAGTGIWLPQSAYAQATALKWANLSPGFTILITEYIRAKGLAKKHGLNLAKPITYGSVPTYYDDFVVGNYDVCIGSWDTFAARYLAGVPLQFVCALTTANMINIIAPKGGVTSIKQLAGKTLAAPQSTGTYRLTRAVVKDLEGIDIQTAIKIQNVTNPAAAVTLVMADRADAGLSWEPSISSGLIKQPDLRILYNVGQNYKKKLNLDLPYFGIAARKSVIDRDPGVVAKLNAMFAECVAGIMGNVDEAVRIVGTRTGIPADVMSLAISSNRLQFKHISMANEKGRETIKTASGFLIRNKMLPREIDAKFFAS
ncbi:MAG: twin-arginine translocation signal domain-containing protein [Burkholderiaceae bacterium]|nr:MAG: twin-arginine translocation signal domain-containing protein [Burkholderiaceae bacterium]TAM07708.1 MAG: twin-arginine translocation signal domain-containing protein [Pusillimonas sp.]